MSNANARSPWEQREEMRRNEEQARRLREDRERRDREAVERRKRSNPDRTVPTKSTNPYKPW